MVRPIDVGNSSAAYTHEYVSVLARHDGNFNFVLPPEDLSRGLYFPFPRPSDESDSSWPFRVSEGAQPTLDNMPLKQGQLATAQIDGQLKDAPGVQADLQVDHGALTGIVTNRTGGRLSDAYIVVDSDFRPLGTLERDQASQIDFLLPPRPRPATWPPRPSPTSSRRPARPDEQGASARRDWLESLFSARFLFARMELRGPTLVGWLEQAPDQIMAPDFRLSQADFTLLVQPLQPQLPVGFDGEVPAAAMNRRDLGIGSGAPTDRDYYTVAPGEAITLQFMIPPSEGTFQMQQLRLNIEGVVQGRVRQTQLPFTVSLFNWRVGRVAGLGGRLRQQHRARRRPLRLGRRRSPPALHARRVAVVDRPRSPPQSPRRHRRRGRSGDRSEAPIGARRLEDERPALHCGALG